jgi:hypothetical protein
MKRALSKLAVRALPYVVIALRVIFSETRTELEQTAKDLITGMARRFITHWGTT